MTNTVFKFYKENLGLYNLIFVNFKGWYYSFIYSPIIAMAIMAISLFFNKPLGILAFFLPFGGLYIILNKKVKNILKKKYSIVSTECMWNSVDVLNKIRESEKQKLKKQLYLMDEEINEIEIQKISEDLLKESIQRKVKFPIIPSVFAILLVPVWNGFVEWLFRYQSINNFNYAALLLLLLVLLIIMITGVLMMIKWVINDFFDNFANKDSKQMKKLSELLNEILYDMEREKRKNSKKQSIGRGSFI